tara:strand:- start:2197 stop:2394 length:198 start_codon:yes stop_codon:yes gene_type:complete
MTCIKFKLERTWGRNKTINDGTPLVKNTNNMENTELTEKQKQILLLKNINNKNIRCVLGYSIKKK